MEAIGIEPGDKVWLITDLGRQKIRCLPLDETTELPLDTMWTNFTPPYSKEEHKTLALPWITMDLQTRLRLNQSGVKSNNLKPWDAVLVGRYLPHALASELSTVSMGLALSALGGAVVIPDSITESLPWLPLSIIVTSFIIVLFLIGLKIRSRI